MKSFLENPVRFSFVFILLVYSFCIYFFRWNNKPFHDTRTIIDSDGKGYYAYLPAIFIYKDLSCSFYYGKDSKKISRYFNSRFINDVSGKNFFKVYCGEALVLSPFFLVAKIFAPANSTGYEKPFQVMVSMAALFYFICGLIFTAGILRSYLITEKLIAAVLFVLSFGTNLFYYTVMLPSMSHVYSFFAVAGFFYFARTYLNKPQAKNILLASAFAGVIFLIRPVNLTAFAMLPFLSANFGNFKNTMVRLFSSKSFYVAIIVFALICSIQQLIFYLQAGTFTFNSYPNEGFYFLHPVIYKALLSFHKGWLIYCPVFILIFPGLWFIFKKSPYLFSSFSVFFLLTIYIISSWWNWYYGPGFGLRPMIDFYAAFSIPLAFAFSEIKNLILKKAVYLFAAFCIVLNLIQSWQYSAGILHAESMNFEKYKYVFLKTGKHYYSCLGGGNLGTYLKRENLPFFDSANNFETTQLHWSVVEPVSESSGNHYQSLQNSEYSTLLSFVADSVTLHKDFFLLVTLRRIEKEINAAENARLVISYHEATGNQYLWDSFKINDLPRFETGQWKNFEYYSPFPKPQAGNHLVKIYVWNPDKKNIGIDDFRVRLYFYKINP